MFKTLSEKQLINLGVSFVILTFLTGCPGIELDCTTKQTTKPRHLKKLLETSKCRGCNLGNADLSGANLRDANLRGTSLGGTNFKNAIMPDGTIYKENSPK